MANFIKNKLWHSCFPVNFDKFLKRPFDRTPRTTASMARNSCLPFLSLHIPDPHFESCCGSHLVELQYL